MQHVSFWCILSLVT